jgi:hypothetical protein
MRNDMARVIVERPRRKVRNSRKGRCVALDDLPSHEGLRRAKALCGDRKELNENLKPLKRYLERQVGRPWRKVYAEISQNLRIDSTVQQHVRDHLRDFVAVTPRYLHRWWADVDLWWQPLYVDPTTGLLCRTDRLPQEKARLRAERHRPTGTEHIALGKNRELRLISGVWHEVRFASLPEPEYSVADKTQKRFRNCYSAHGRASEAEADAPRLITPGVRDAVTGAVIAAGPAIDHPASWKRYRLEHPTRVYAVSKRALSRHELRRRGLKNSPPEQS